MLRKIHMVINKRPSEVPKPDVLLSQLGITMGSVIRTNRIRDIDHGITLLGQAELCHTLTIGAHPLVHL